MGWSCTAEQSKAMEELFKAEHAQEKPKWGERGSYAFDGYIPQHDYGYPPHVNVNLSILLMASEGTAYDAGKAVIAPDGTYKLPVKVRKAMGL